jgi:hypothetical protein
MKKLLCTLLCSLIFSPSSILARIQEPQEISKKPHPEISEFYDNLNCVIAFSSYSERVELTKYLAEKDLPEKFNRRRLAKVFRLMKKIEARIIKEDPKIVIWTKPPSEPVYYSGLIEIKKIQPEADKIRVEVIVYHLKSAINEQLIARYDEAGIDEKKVPKEEEMLGIVKPGAYQNEEVHIWVIVNGEWKKKEANFVLLK